MAEEPPTPIDKNVRRKFVWAPDMDKLRESIEQVKADVEGSFDRIDGMAEEIEEAVDLKQRLAHVVLAIRDRERGVLDELAFNDEINKAIESVDWPDWLVSELAATT